MLSFDEFQQALADELRQVSHLDGPQQQKFLRMSKMVFGPKAPFDLEKEDLRSCVQRAASEYEHPTKMRQAIMGEIDDRLRGRKPSRTDKSSSSRLR